ncbi:MAG TPA: UvrD-helicase domain-containing protein [Methanoregula sp.]|nr:UvrD-helicase domain-containing protein [Methanoregula sp.]
MPLNPSQQRAVTGTGIQLVLAGPGSGKTRVITEKIVHLIQTGIKPENVLALTFSDKAAAEMSDRIEENRPHPGLAIPKPTTSLRRNDPVHPACAEK